MQTEVAVIGAGIVGLATGLALTAANAALRPVFLEKESEVGTHQTGHNSGVLHSGIYYKPGSLKAQLCVAGYGRMVAFCAEHGIDHQFCGKLIVATSDRELPALQELFRRGNANGVPGLRLLAPAEMKIIEPEAAGVAAIHSPATGIVDYREVARQMAAVLTGRGAEIRRGAALLGVTRRQGSWHLTTSQGELDARYVINCAGLYADRVARMMGAEPDVQIVPFRGEYYFLAPHAGTLVRGLIYPVPDPDLPFLGVHLTRTVHGRVEAGPNAVLALAREGYARASINLGELAETLRYRGFRQMSRRWWKVGVYEYYRSFSKGAFTRSLQHLVPAIRATDLVPGGAGVRAQAIAADGSLVDDFRIVPQDGAIHVLNAPSPAATASLAIGDHIARAAGSAFGLR